MASAMQQTMQTCQDLCIRTQAQMIDEDKVDPFPAKTTAELEEMYLACQKTKVVLSRESLIYSHDADFSRYSDQELVAMNAFVRENSRMLSIILAGGAQHFWNGSGSTTTQELKNMYPFIDGKVKEFLLIDKILQTLDIKMRYGRTGMVNKKAQPATHPELLAFSAIDSRRGETSQESLARLATVCEQFAEQCRSIGDVRAKKMQDRLRKVEVYEHFLLEVDSVLPLLRQHVLKIGLSKTYLQESKPIDCALGGAAKVDKNTSKLTNLFTYKAVEAAHRSVEDCRERLMQEMVFRKSKVERRLKREEEKELEEELLVAQRLQIEQETGRKQGSPTKAYDSLEDFAEKAANNRQSRKTVPPKDGGDATVRSNSPQRNRRGNSPPSRSASPKSKAKAGAKAKSPTKEVRASMANALDKSLGISDGPSPRSPKAKPRSKK